MKTLVHRITLFATLLLLCANADAKGVFADENDWTRYTSLSFALPITSWDYDTDAADGETDTLIPLSFDSTGYTFDYQAHHVSPNKGFTVLTNWGLGGYSGDFELSDGTIKETNDENAEKEYETFTLGDNTGFMVYFNLGFGKAFELAKKRIAILPTAGVGLNIYMLTKAEGIYEVEEGSEDASSTDATDAESNTQASYTYRDFDAVLNVFFNLTVAFMFSEKYGISLSCQLSIPAFGVGLCTTSTDSDDSATVYMLDMFSSVNFMPAVGLCIRL